MIAKVLESCRIQTCWQLEPKGVPVIAAESPTQRPKAHTSHASMSNGQGSVDQAIGIDRAASCRGRRRNLDYDERASA